MLDNIAQIDRAWLIKDLKRLSLSNNVKLARSKSGKHKSRIQKVPGPIPTGGNFFAEIILLFPIIANTANFV